MMIVLFVVPFQQPTSVTFGEGEGTYSKKGETRGRQGKEGEEGQGGEDCQTADMTNTGRISPSFTNEVGCERAAALLKVFNALRRC